VVLSSDQLDEMPEVASVAAIYRQSGSPHWLPIREDAVNLRFPPVIVEKLVFRDAGAGRRFNIALRLTLRP